MTSTKSYRITGYYDLREWDEAVGGRIPLPAGEGATCSRCGRLHAKVYNLVERDELTGAEQEFTTGSGCAKQLAYNGDPGKFNLEAKEARAAYRAKLAEAREAATRAAVAEVVTVASAILAGHVLAFEVRPSEWTDREEVVAVLKLADGRVFEGWAATVQGRPVDQERRDCATHEAFRLFVATLELPKLPRGLTEYEARRQVKAELGGTAW